MHINNEEFSSEEVTFTHPGIDFPGNQVRTGMRTRKQPLHPVELRSLPVKEWVSRLRGLISSPGPAFVRELANFTLSAWHDAPMQVRIFRIFETVN